MKLAPGKLEFQLQMYTLEQATGEFGGAAAWLVEGLKVQEEQYVIHSYQKKVPHEL